MDHNPQPHNKKRDDCTDASCRKAAKQLVKEFRQRAKKRREKATSLFSMERSRHFAAATAYEDAADMLEDKLLSS